MEGVIHKNLAWTPATRPESADSGHHEMKSPSNRWPVLADCSATMWKTTLYLSRNGKPKPRPTPWDTLEWFMEKVTVGSHPPKETFYQSPPPVYR